METLLAIGYVNAVWVCALALLAALADRLCRRPGLSHVLWMLVLLKFITPPFVHVVIPDATTTGHQQIGPDLASVPVLELTESEATQTVPAGTVPADLTPAAVEAREIPWKGLLTSVWGTGSAFMAALALSRIWSIRRLMHLSRPAAKEDQLQAAELANRLGLRCKPNMLLVDTTLPPLVCGWIGGPVLLVPAALWQSLSVDQRATLLAHELAHLVRRDHWLRWLELAVLILFWWHPVAWVARRRVQEAEEDCCDALVVWLLPEAAPSYADALLETVAFLTPSRPALPTMASGMGQFVHLRRRLSMILHAPRSRPLASGTRLLVLSTGLALLVLLPAWSQSSPTVVQDPIPTPAPARIPARTSAPAATPQPVPPISWRSEVGTPQPADATWTTRTARTVPAQELRDEIDLLKVQMISREAELKEAQALLKQARSQAQSMERNVARGAVSITEAERARTEVEVMEARLLGKEALIKENQLRIDQAQRRLSAQSRATSSGTTPAPRTTGSSGSTNINTARGALTPSTGTPTIPSTSAAPSPTGGATSATTARGARAPVLRNAPTSGTSEDRLENLERSLQKLLQELNHVRDEIRKSRGSDSEPRGGSTIR